MPSDECNFDEISAGGRVQASGANGRIATITLGVDGRLYFHDLPPEFLEVAAEICPEAPAVTERLKLAAHLCEGKP